MQIFTKGTIICFLLLFFGILLAASGLPFETKTIETKYTTDNYSFDGEGKILILNNTEHEVEKIKYSNGTLYTYNTVTNFTIYQYVLWIIVVIAISVFAICVHRDVKKWM